MNVQLLEKSTTPPLPIRSSRRPQPPSAGLSNADSTATLSNSETPSDRISPPADQSRPQTKTYSGQGGTTEAGSSSRNESHVGSFTFPPGTTFPPGASFTARDSFRGGSHHHGDVINIESKKQLSSEYAYDKEIKTTVNFTGREQEIKTIKDMHDKANLAIVYGLNGIGKSRLTYEYARRTKKNYAIQWKVSANNEQDLLNSLWRFNEDASDESLQNVTFAKKKDFAHKILSELQKEQVDKERALILVDGLGNDSKYLLTDYFPENIPLPENIPEKSTAKPGVDLLVSTHLSHWGTQFPTIKINSWEREEAKSYIKKETLYRGRTGRHAITEGETDDISRDLGEHPLAISHAAAYLAEYPRSRVSEYLVDVMESLEKNPDLPSEEKLVNATFQTAIKKAEKETAGTAALLINASCLAPAAVPVKLLSLPLPEMYDAMYTSNMLRPMIDGDEDNRGLGLFAAKHAESKKGDILSTLNRLSLIDIDDEKELVVMHSLLSKAVQRSLANEKSIWKASIAQALDVMIKNFTSESNDIRHLVSPDHIQNLLKDIDSPVSNDYAYSISELAIVGINQLRMEGRVNESEELAAYRSKILKEKYGPESMEYANGIKTEGMVQHAAGNYEKAEKIMRKAIEVYTKATDNKTGEYYRFIVGLSQCIGGSGVKNEQIELIEPLSLSCQAKHVENPQKNKFSSELFFYHGMLLYSTMNLVEAKALFNLAIETAEHETAQSSEHSKLYLSTFNLPNPDAETERLSLQDILSHSRHDLNTGFRLLARGSEEMKYGNIKDAADFYKEGALMTEKFSAVPNHELSNLLKIQISYLNKVNEGTLSYGEDMPTELADTMRKLAGPMSLANGMEKDFFTEFLETMNDSVKGKGKADE